MASGDGDVAIRLGSTPRLLPEPLAELGLELVATRCVHTGIGQRDRSLWLSPGQRRGLCTGADRLGQGLIALGVHPGQARSTALLPLATEVPAAVGARMFGIHIKVAVAWRHAVSGDWVTYAADRPRQDPPALGVSVVFTGARSGDYCLWAWLTR